MMKMRFGSFIILLVTVLLISTLSAYAELYNRGTDSLGNRLIYDSDLNITWYDYVRYDDNNYMNNSYWKHMNWAAGLSVDFGGTIYDDWRLPSTGVNQYFGPGYDGTTKSGYNIMNSEMGHLFYTELDNKGRYDTSGNLQSGYGLTNKGPFQNLRPDYYWSTTEDWRDSAYYFIIGTGFQGITEKGDPDLAGLAVRSGDVAVVPEPISFILFITGGGLLAGRRLIKMKA